jgi:hypothetical protein
VIIIGGVEEDDEDVSMVVEEIDFLKRNLVSLPQTKIPRRNGNAFMVNDSIYVFGGSSKVHGITGEKYTLSENKWREVKPKNLDLAQKMPANFVTGPAALLYE